MFIIILSEILGTDLKSLPETANCQRTRTQAQMLLQWFTYNQQHMNLWFVLAREQTLNEISAN